MADKSMSTVVAQHYNQREEKGIKARVKSRIIHLRNFNNWIKSMLIAEYAKKFKTENEAAKLTVLDVGSGKGGDLLKWKKNDCGHLVCADIAEISVQQCKDRYMEMLRRHIKQSEKGDCFTAEFVVADFGKDHLKKKYKKQDIQFDLVSCQFAFHYCFESFKQAKTMIQNVSESLKPGGYFIGTLPDGYEIMKKLHNSPDCTFGNDIYSVKFRSKEAKDTTPLFGQLYDFQLEGVVDCPEYLVYFPAFVKLAKEYGNLELVRSIRFNEYFDEFSKTTEGDSLLVRMKALETFPPPDSVKLTGGEDEYFFAEKQLESLQTDDKDISDEKKELRVGTLTKSEWEIVCMYMVFAFKKLDPVKKEECQD